MSASTSDPAAETEAPAAEPIDWLDVGFCAACRRPRQMKLPCRCEPLPAGGSIGRRYVRGQYDAVELDGQTFLRVQSYGDPELYWIPWDGPPPGTSIKRYDYEEHMGVPLKMLDDRFDALGSGDDDGR